jgi:hypothetical protein
LESDVDSDGKHEKALEEISDEAKSENEALELLAGQLHHHVAITELNEQVLEVFAGVKA